MLAEECYNRFFFSMQSNALKVRNFLFIGNPVANLKKKNFPRMCLLNKKIKTKEALIVILNSLKLKYTIYKSRKNFRPNFSKSFPLTF